MESIASILGTLANLSILQAIIVTMLAMLAYGVWYYYAKIFPVKQKAEERKNEKMISIEERRAEDQKQTNQHLRQSATKQEVLMANNIEAIKDLGKIIELLNATFEKVSDRISEHDARSEHMNDMIASMYDKMPSKDSVTKIHSRMDTMAKDLVGKQDVQQILLAINGLDKKVDKTN